MFNFKLLTIFVVITIQYCNSYRILGLFPHPGISHFRFFQPILKGLAEKGHDVTVVSHFPNLKPIENYTDLVLPGEILTNAIDLNSDWFVNRRYYGRYYEFKFVYDWGKDACNIAYSSTAIHKILSESTKQFDVILIESFNTDCLYGVAWKLQAPVIALSSCNLMPWHGDRVGQPNIPSYIPTLFLPHNEKMTLSQRVINFVDAHFMRFLYRFFVDQYTNEMLQTIFGKEIPSIEDLRKQTSLTFENRHYSLSGAKPISNAVIELGGIHIGAAKKLDRKMKEFLDAAVNGVVLMSWGSMVKADTMPIDKRNSFLNAFGSFKQYKFVWKWENDTLPNKPSNVFIYQWLQQREILCHPNVKAFITHAGLLGGSEAAYCGVPVISIPLYGDQFFNAAAFVNRGMGATVNYEDITKENIEAALHIALHPKTQKNAKQVSYSFRNRQQTPLQTAIWWVEHVAATAGAPLTKSYSVFMPGFIYHSFDIYLIILLALICLISSWIWVLMKFCGKHTKNTKLKSN